MAKRPSDQSTNKIAVLWDWALCSLSYVPHSDAEFGRLLGMTLNFTESRLVWVDPA
jgi:hypothetical protein